MATIRKLRDKWQAIVKRSGFPLQSKSFHNKADARKWAREAESALDNGIVITGKGIATAPITAVTASTDAPNTINAHDCPTVADRGGRSISTHSAFDYQIQNREPKFAPSASPHWMLFVSASVQADICFRPHPKVDISSVCREFGMPLQHVLDYKV